MASQSESFPAERPRRENRSAILNVLRRRRGRNLGEIRFPCRKCECLDCASTASQGRDRDDAPRVEQRERGLTKLDRFAFVYSSARERNDACGSRNNRNNRALQDMTVCGLGVYRLLERDRDDAPRVEQRGSATKAVQ